MKTYKLDIIFILLLTAFLLFLLQIGQMDKVMDYPFVIIYSAYIIGRIAGKYSK
jgi:hypothetical protein